MICIQLSKYPVDSNLSWWFSLRESLMYPIIQVSNGFFRYTEYPPKMISIQSSKCLAVFKGFNHPKIHWWLKGASLDVLNLYQETTCIQSSIYPSVSIKSYLKTLYVQWVFVNTLNCCLWALYWGPVACSLKALSNLRTLA